MAKLKLRPAEVGPTGRAVACSKMRGLAPFGGRRRGQHEAATGATIGHALFVLIEEPIMLRLRGPLEKHAGRRLVRKQLSNGLASSRRRSTSGEKRHGDRRRRAREGLIPSRSLADSWGGFPGGHRYGSRWRSPVWRSPWLLPSRSALTLMPPNSVLWRSARGIPIRPAAFWLWRRSLMGPPAPKRLRSAA